MPLSIEEVINNSKYFLAKCEFVKSNFPEVKISYPTWNRHFQLSVMFSSKLVNSKYEKFNFIKKYNTLYVSPYLELKFDYNGKEELIRINSSPKINKLATVSFKRNPAGHNRKTISFSRLAINLKNNHFKDDMLNSCCVEIMQFIKANPNCDLDTKHLAPRLAKLLMFT